MKGKQIYFTSNSNLFLQAHRINQPQIYGWYQDVIEIFLFFVEISVVTGTTSRLFIYQNNSLHKIKLSTTIRANMKPKTKEEQYGEKKI